jgi:hypothetical protein
MNLLHFFKQIFNSKESRSWHDEIPENHLLMWEDDDCMRELIPKSNKIFLEKETKRIAEFSTEHRDGIGFTDITEIQEPETKLSDLGIKSSEIEKVLISNGLEPVKEIWNQSSGTVNPEKLPIAYGNTKFAIIVYEENGIANRIWFVGNIDKTNPPEKICDSVYAICNKYELAAVNWYSTEFSLCEDFDSTKKFVENCI